MNPEMEHLCQGCTEWDGNHNSCSIFLAEKVDECRCVECMVKMVCYLPCKEFDKLWEKACKILGIDHD